MQKKKKKTLPRTDACPRRDTELGTCGSKAAGGLTREDKKLQKAGEKPPALGRLRRCLGHEIVRQPRSIR